MRPIDCTVKLTSCVFQFALFARCLRETP